MRVSELIALLQALPDQSAPITVYAHVNGDTYELPRIQLTGGRFATLFADDPNE